MRFRELDIAHVTDFAPRTGYRFNDRGDLRWTLRDFKPTKAHNIRIWYGLPPGHGGTPAVAAYGPDASQRKRIEIYLRRLDFNGLRAYIRRIAERTPEDLLRILYEDNKQSREGAIRAVEQYKLELAEEIVYRLGRRMERRVPRRRDWAELT